MLQCLDLWPHAWPWIFTVRFWNSRISEMGGLIDIEKGYESTIHDHDCDLFATKVRCKDLLDSDRGEFRCRRAVDASSFCNYRYHHSIILKVYTLLPSIAAEKAFKFQDNQLHYSDIKMTAMASQITGDSIVCWAVCSGVDQQIKENVKAPRHWPLYRWIPLIKVTGHYTGGFPS